MEKQVQIECQYTTDEKVENILHQSFDLYLKRCLTERQNVAQ